MQELGADIPKIAVMPQNKKDVLTLLAATEEMVNNYADRPIITMSMAATGVISRVCGEVFGSALTFGAVGKASAPGQMGAGELKEMLTTLHASLWKLFVGCPCKCRIYFEKDLREASDSCDLTGSWYSDMPL